MIHSLTEYSFYSTIIHNKNCKYNGYICKNNNNIEVFPMFKEILKPSVARAKIRVSIDAAVTDKSFGLHFHRHYELFYAQVGERIFYVEGKEHRLEQGEIIFIGRQVPHSTQTPKGARGVLLQFDDQPVAAAEEIYLPAPQGAAAVQFDAASPYYNELRECFERIAAEHQSAAPAADLYLRAYTLQIEACLTRAGVLAREERGGERLSALLPALEYINAHYAEPIALEQISALLNIDKAHCCRLFKKAVGMPFLQYLHRLRIYRTEQLLTETDLSVSEIADRVGFCSAAYFAETFKKVHSHTPREHRRLQTDRRI